MDKQHLTLNDINIGDYVQEWLEIPGKWGTPMYIDGIFADGDVYLNLEGNEADPFDSNVKDIYDIPIDYGILPHFGFEEDDHNVWKIERDGWVMKVDVCKMFTGFIGRGIISKEGERSFISKHNLNSIRKIQHFFYDKTGIALKLNFD
jgi:hypothetical protein